MPGRLLDWLGQGDYADRPAAADVNGTGPGQLGIPLGSCVLYFASDTNVLSIFDEPAVDWFEIDMAAVSGLAFETLPDVDWSTPPTDGQVFVWDTGSSKLVPYTIPALPTLLYNTAEELQDAVGAMFANGTGITAAYNDGTGMIDLNVTITQYTDELAQDALAGAFAAGTHTGITVTYDDVGNAFDFALTYAVASDIFEGADATLVISPAELIAAMDPTSVTYAATIPLDLDTGFNFEIGTLTGDLLLDNPTNDKEGQSGVIWVKQDGTGGRTVTFGTDWRFPGGAAANPVPENPNDETTIAYICKGGLIYATVSGDFIA